MHDNCILSQISIMRPTLELVGHFEGGYVLQPHPWHGHLGHMEWLRLIFVLHEHSQGTETSDDILASSSPASSASKGESPTQES